VACGNEEEGNMDFEIPFTCDDNNQMMYSVHEQVP
jgi:hypothetical protein